VSSGSRTKLVAKKPTLQEQILLAAQSGVTESTNKESELLTQSLSQVDSSLTDCNLETSSQSLFKIITSKEM
jgi:hypothetical protein